MADENNSPPEHLPEPPLMPSVEPSWATGDRKLFLPSRPFIVHGLLSVGLILVASIAGNLLNFQAERVAQRWTEGLKYAATAKAGETRDKENLNLYLDGFPTASAAERDRIQVQLTQVERRARAYARITTFFYTRFFAAIALASTTGIIAGICLFYISKVGWKDANNYIVNIFVVSSGITVLVGAFPVTFQQENNIQKNAQLYMSYINLESQLLTALASQKDDQGQPLDLHSIIVSADKTMAELNIESIGFDATGIPQNQTIFQQLTE